MNHSTIKLNLSSAKVASVLIELAESELNHPDGYPISVQGLAKVKQRPSSIN